MARAQTDKLPRPQNQRPSQRVVEPAPPIVPAESEEPKKGRRPQMMRQYDLIDRVKTYNPTANEDLLNRAYVYAMKRMASQTRASGEPVFFPSARGRRDFKPTSSSTTPPYVAALLHDTIEDTEATRRRNRREVRPRDRCAGRRADQAEEARPGHPRGKAGREPAQAAARDRRRTCACC